MSATPRATVPSVRQRDGILQFLEHTERLKDVLRSAHTAEGRQESTAEHSWRLCLWAMSLGPWLPHIDQHRLLKLAVLHDLGEALHGDTPATEQPQDPTRKQREAEDFLTLTAPLPEPLRSEFRTLWNEYDSASTAEARLAKGMDKLETMLQHVQGRNPDDFDYSFNLRYGRCWTDDDVLLSAMREPVDAATRARDAGESIEGPDGRRTSVS